jgi:hypothetical protein
MRLCLMDVVCEAVRSCRAWDGIDPGLFVSSVSWLTEYISLTELTNSAVLVFHGDFGESFLTSYP